MEAILVTGGCGYIGSHICKKLCSEGYQVIVIDDLSTGSKNNLFSNETFYLSDFSNTKTIDHIIEKHNIKAVIHLAASISVSESCEKPTLYYENNFVKTKIFIEHISSRGIENLIFSSTAAVYGQFKEKATEESLLHPINPYGKSKLACEWFIFDLAKTTRLRYCTLRYFNVAGADPQKRIGQKSKNATHLIKKTCRVACEKESSLTVFGTDYQTTDGTCIRDYIHVEDLSNAHIQALRYLLNGGKSTTLNCGYSRGYSVLEVLSSMEKIINKKIPILLGQRRQGDSPQLIADSQKIRKLLNWVPQYDNLEQILRHSLAWEKTI